MTTPVPHPRSRPPAGTAHHRAVIAASVLLVAGSIPSVLAGGLGVQIREELSLSTSRFGVTFSLSAFAVGALSLAAGVILDRFGWRRSLAIAAAASCTCLLGLASSDSWLSLTLWILVGAMGMAFALPTGNVMLTRVVPAERLGLTMGLKQTAGSWSALYAGFAVAVLAASLGWRWVMLTGLFFPALAIITAPPGGVATNDRPNSPLPRYTDEGRPWRLRFLVIGGIGMVTSQALMAFVVITLVDAGTPQAVAGMALGVGSAVSIATQIATGSRADRRHQDGLWSVGGLFVVTTTGLVLLAIRHPLLVVAGSVIALGAGRGWQGQFFYAVVRISASTAGAATGLAVLGMGAGAALGPVLFGILADEAGHTVGWATIALLTAFGAVLAFLSSDTVSRGSDRTHP